MKIKIILLLVICTALVADISAQQCVQCEGGENPGTNASIIGTDNIASGNESFAGGKYSEAQGKRSIAFGENALTISSYSVAMGQDVTAFGGASIVLGRNLMNTSPSIIFGSGFDDDNRLKNTTPNCLIVGFNSTKPTFFVGESTNGANSTGRIGIGNVTDPQAKLHIREDENYDEASVYIQASNPERPAYLWLGDTSFGVQKQNNSLEFLTNGYYLFNNGNVGIGTADPSAELEVAGKIKTEGLEASGDIFIEDIDHGIVMKSPNGSCWRGTLTDEGQLQFTEVDCDELTVSTPEPEPAQNAGIRIYPNPTGNHVTVEIPAVQSGARLSIKSTGGKELATLRLDEPRQTISMGNYPAGIYFFYISADDKLLEVKKVIKE